MAIKDEMQKSVEVFVATVSDLAKRMAVDALNSALGASSSTACGKGAMEKFQSDKGEIFLNKTVKRMKKAAKKIVKRAKKAAKAHAKKIAKSERKTVKHAEQTQTVWVRKASKKDDVVAPPQIADAAA